MAEMSLAQLRKQAEASGVTAGGGGGLAPGTYLAKVVEAIAGSSASGKQQFKLKFEVAAGPEAGKTIRETLTISPESDKALAIAFGVLDILGATSAVERDADPSEVANAMLGSTASIVTWIDDGANYDNVPRSKVRYINAPPAGVTVNTTTRTTTPF